MVFVSVINIIGTEVSVHPEGKPLQPIYSVYCLTQRNIWGIQLLKNHHNIFSVLMIIALSCPAAADGNPFEHRSAGRMIESRENIGSDRVVSETIRFVTAYNVGDPAQNYGDPCIAASGENLCKALSAGKKRCAANFVPLGTRLYIEDYGIFLVSDRTNRRYRNRVDIAMKLDEIHKAKQFGKKKLNVKILRDPEMLPPRRSARIVKATLPLHQESY